MTRSVARQCLVLATVTTMLTVCSCGTNRAPDVPGVPSGPDYCIADSVYTFTAVASDPDGDSLALRFDWGDSTVSHWEGWFASGQTVAFTHAWSDTGTYGVCVSAQDQRLLVSGSSDSLTVRVVYRRPPETPTTPTGPTVGVTDSSYTFVAGANHPDGDDVAIRCAWGEGDTSGWSEYVLPSVPAEMSHAWSTPGTYVVRAQARDTHGLTSQWSDPHDITIGRPGHLKMVGDPVIGPDGRMFLINIMNAGTRDDTVSWLAFLPASAALYLRDDFRIHSDHDGFPGVVPGKGPGDTIRFTAPAVIAPDGLIEVFFNGFYTTPNPTGADTTAVVAGRTFKFRFSDGSEITVKP